MNSLKISSEKLRLENASSHAIMSALERAFTKLHLDFYLVGALARDVSLLGIHNMTPARITADIDFAVLINNVRRYNSLKNYLINIEGFHPSKENAFVLIWEDRVQVDLLPFGSIEENGGKVTVDGVGLTTVNVPGFKEVYEHGLPEATLDEAHTFKFCTLEGIVLLKLIAWDDRPEMRGKDIEDICTIMDNYFNIIDDEIYEDHNDLFEGEYELIDLAAEVLGRKMRQIAQRNEQVYQRLMAILENATSNIEKSRLGDLMTTIRKGTTVAENIALLNRILKGLK